MILTPALLLDTFTKYSWPEKYIVVDESPEYIMIKFNNCSLIFVEADDEIKLYFSSRETKTNYNLSLFDAIHYVFTIKNKLHLNNNNNPILDLKKVRDDLEDICILLQEYLLPSIQGNFDWVEEYKTKIK